MEKFEPNKPEYKNVEDLPRVEQNKYVNVPGGGFTTKEAASIKEWREMIVPMLADDRTLLEKLTGKKKMNAQDLIHHDALYYEKYINSFKEDQNYLKFYKPYPQIKEFFDDLLSTSDLIGTINDFNSKYGKEKQNNFEEFVIKNNINPINVIKFRIFENGSSKIVWFGNSESEDDWHVNIK